MLLQGLQFSDKDEHMYFWFPLLAGLSELTFDPRPDIRYSALEVLFDTLKFHGSAFTLPFWTRIFDSVLLPIFDHVRAEVMLLPPPFPSDSSLVYRPTAPTLLSNCVGSELTTPTALGSHPQLVWDWAA